MPVTLCHTGNKGSAEIAVGGAKRASRPTKLTGYNVSRVLIADDHALARAGYRQFLEGESSISNIGEAGSFAEALEALDRGRWDLLILDINMPDRNGFDILAEVKAHYPYTKVLVISGFPEGQYAENVLKAGASGYLSKSTAPTELMHAVRTVLGGRRYRSDEARGKAAEENPAPELPHTELSTREFQIFLKLAAGASVTAIAAELELNVKTVSTFRGRILAKMRMQSNADITAYALKNGMMH
jgi:DNA-binding NarL/FixJ family response regulator